MSMKIAGYISALAAIYQSAKPITVKQISRKAGYTAYQLSYLINRFHRAQLIHIAEWTRPTGRGTWVPSYKFGNDVDATYPGIQRAHSKRTSSAYNRPTLIAFCELVRQIQGGNVSVPEISTHTGLCLIAVRSALKSMREAGLSHIGAWKRRDRGVGGRPTALWTFGPGDDAAALTPLSNSERCRRYSIRLRVKASRPDIESEDRLDRAIQLLRDSHVHQGISGAELSVAIGCDLEDLSLILASALKDGRVIAERFEAVTLWKAAWAPSKIPATRIERSLGVSRIFSDAEAL